MLCAYRPQDMSEAQLLRQILADSHVNCYVSGEYLQGGIGELPAADLLGLWVSAQDLGLARELISDWQQATPIMSEMDDL
jgi:acyl-CoA hydrolase